MKIDLFLSGFVNLDVEYCLDPLGNKIDISAMDTEDVKAKLHSGELCVDVSHIFQDGVETRSLVMIRHQTS